MEDLLIETDKGLYCPKGDFYLDPKYPVKKALVSHAHGDHATWGCESYLTSKQGVDLLRLRVTPGSKIEGLEFGEQLIINGVTVRFMPAGHILGSSQIVVEIGGSKTVYSGDYKTSFDGSCVQPFEPVRCDTFITESTFGLPIYRWRPQQEIFNEINSWWRRNKEEGVTSVILAYALGKAQRILHGVDPSIGPIFVHGTVTKFDAAYRAQGVTLPDYQRIDETTRLKKAGALVIAPPSVQATSWLNKLSPFSLGFASGWMHIRGMRRRKGVDKGFVLSDHCDFDELNHAVKATGANRIWVTHGYRESYSRYLCEQGFDAKPLGIQYDEGEGEGLGEQEKQTTDQKAGEP